MIWRNTDSFQLLAGTSSSGSQLLSFGAGGIHLRQQVRGKCLYRPRSLDRFRQRIPGFGGTTQLGVGESETIEGNGTLLIILPSEQCAGGLELGNRSRSFVLLHVDVAQSGMCDPGGHFAGAVGVGRVGVGGGDRLLSKGGGFGGAAGLGTVPVAPAQET